MKYICVTNIDADTGVICTSEPMRTGPSMPAVKGLRLDWANESVWPVACNPDGSYATAPKYYGVCDDDADLTIAGVLEVIAESEWAQRKHDEFYARQPFPSWVWNAETFTWSSPTPYPNDGKQYRWSESTLSWVEVAE